MKHSEKVIVWIILFLGISQFSGNLESTKLEITAIPSDFIYDGCSMIPDGDLLDCCTLHDQGYFFGGSWQERLKVDNEFYSCVQDKWHWYSSTLAPIMWSWVRVWWAPVLPTSYRWGFGRDMY